MSESCQKLACGLDFLVVQPGVGRWPARGLRMQNRRRVLEALRCSGALSQAEIARQTGLSRATVSSLVSELRGAGLVVDAPAERQATSQGGRPPVVLALDDSAGAVLGIDFGHSHVRVAVANLAHTVLAERCVYLDVDGDAQRPMAAAVEMVGEVLTEAGVDRSRVLGVGMGLPGPIDRARGTVGSPSILPGWVGVRAAEEMSTRLGLPVALDNDANLGALAETMWGAGQGLTHVAYIKASTGIGSGLVIDGRLYRGATGSAGEIGHTVVDEQGLVCYCGNRGCLETLAGGAAIIDLLRRSHGGRFGESLPANLGTVLRLAAEGDLGCRRALGDVSHQIGIAVANLCNLFNPQRVVIGGTLSLAGDLVLEPIRRAVRRHTTPVTAGTVDVVAGILGDRAEVLGALALVLREAGRDLPMPWGRIGLRGERSTVTATSVRERRSLR